MKQIVKRIKSQSVRYYRIGELAKGYQALIYKENKSHKTELAKMNVRISQKIRNSKNDICNLLIIRLLQTPIYPKIAVPWGVVREICQFL